jgi:hypothetical protein
MAGKRTEDEERKEASASRAIIKQKAFNEHGFRKTDLADQGILT